ncbi:50S ribosomal protein L3 [Candidatus Cytomitobacter indipagum]|uniref:50S ribosomal protein L3 n=1 Tax=Candidatus Cytomitobacter indipagum TaxID=2601575 RepID=A0A5C0UET0_9PROT|nr:50S ribosomal protein L3 [Candidatus Cytomitobacter indipagum]QEK38279.1 50S ribosomal protein L3 [Candidatus Cytomitobacter indipagum]
MKNFGLLCRKMGMSQVICDGKFLPLTLLYIESPVVIGFKTMERDGYSAILVGFGHSKLKHWNKSQHVLCQHEERIFEKIKEFRVDDVERFSIGQEIVIKDFFGENDLVSVQGITLGRGFSGGIKRHGFKGLRASHGVSVSHRSIGSTGSRTPSRVWKGKKMPGRYGCETVTIKNVKVKYIEEQTSLMTEKPGSIIGVYGAVPGSKGSFCSIYRSERNRI